MEKYRKFVCEKRPSSRDAWSPDSVGRIIEEGGKQLEEKMNKEEVNNRDHMMAFVSPVKAWAVNFWMNQAFGVFPSSAHESFMTFV